MANINKYLDGLDIKFSEQEKQLADIFAESWEHCRSHTCGDCEYRPNGKHFKVLLCMSCQYAKRLIAADVAPVKHGHIVWKEYRKGGIRRRKCLQEIKSVYIEQQMPCKHIAITDERYLSKDPYCSECGKLLGEFLNYCGNCGAKMDG